MADADLGEKLVMRVGVCKDYISQFNYTEDGECLQFTCLGLANKRLEQLNKCIEEVKDVCEIQLENNSIQDIKPLEPMSRLVRLNVANNKVKGMSVFTNDESFPNLKWLDVSNNKIQEIPALKCPKLEYLNISHNKMEKVNEGWTGHANLRIICAVDNKFKTLAPFKNMPNLEELYMESNSMTTLSGWESLPKLKTLHLRRNKIEKMEEELPELPSLTYLNLRGNNIHTMEMLNRLFQFQALTVLIVTKCPVEREASSADVILAEVLRKSTKLVRFGKTKVDEGAKLQAIYLAEYKYDKEQVELKAKAAEEAAKEAAALENE